MRPPSIAAGAPAAGDSTAAAEQPVTIPLSRPKPPPRSEEPMPKRAAGNEPATAVGPTNTSEAMEPNEGTAVGGETPQQSLNPPTRSRRHPAAREAEQYRRMERDLEALARLKRMAGEALEEAINEMSDPLERLDVIIKTAAAHARLDAQGISYTRLLDQINKRVHDPLKVPPGIWDD